MGKLELSTLTINIEKLLEDLEQNTRKVVLAFDSWTIGESVSSALGQQIIEESKKLIVEHPVTKIVELNHKLNEIQFDYSLHEKELVKHVTAYTKNYLEQKPDADTLCEYIALCSSMGKKVRVFDNNSILCKEIYKLREFKQNSVNTSVDTVKAVAMEVDTKNLSLAFEQAKLIRKEKNINQNELANFLGCSGGTISKIETGVLKGHKELIQGYIYYVSYKHVFTSYNLDKRRKKGK